ncbi:MAG: hypothetical protein LBP59_13770 [Planctomycetaceae bacterium]|nr:hypothetical protein [Planctomycetaceae bacterium]
MKPNTFSRQGCLKPERQWSHLPKIYSWRNAGWLWYRLLLVLSFVQYIQYILSENFGGLIVAVKLFVFNYLPQIVTSIVMFYANKDQLVHFVIVRKYLFSKLAYIKFLAAAATKSALKIISVTKKLISQFLYLISAITTNDNKIFNRSLDATITPPKLIPAPNNIIRIIFKLFTHKSDLYQLNSSTIRINFCQRKPARLQI